MAGLLDGLPFEHALSTSDALDMRQLIHGESIMVLHVQNLRLLLSVVDSIDPLLTLQSQQSQIPMGSQTLFERLATNVEFCRLSSIHLAYHGIPPETIRIVQWTVINETPLNHGLRATLTTQFLDDTVVAEVNGLLRKAGWPAATVLSPRGPAR